eukprot:scaffold142381_cov21-Tisochrysis_lutea.AAC.2
MQSCLKRACLKYVHSAVIRTEVEVFAPGYFQTLWLLPFIKPVNPCEHFFVYVPLQVHSVPWLPLSCSRRLE